MFSALIQILILFFVLIIVPWLIWEIRKRQREQKLRANPAKQAVMELVVPSNVKDANLRAMELWANLRNIIIADDEARAEGLGKVTFMFDVTYHRRKGPRLRCYLYCDKEQEAIIEQTLMGSFKQGELGIRQVQPKDDPRRVYMKELKRIQELEQPAKAQADDGGH